MKIQFFSDIHLEDGDVPYVPADCDVVCIMGDLGVGLTPIDWIDRNLNDIAQPVLYVPGNHEFYYHNLYDTLDVYRARFKEMGVDFLYNNSVIIGDTKFIGTTLWTDFNLHGTQAVKMRVAPEKMSDYICIFGNDGEPYENGKAFLTPQEILTEHQTAVAFIEAELASRQKGHQAVVMTHHAPSAQSLGQRKTNLFAPYYASHLDDLIKKYQPELWMHGHIHEDVEYYIGDTMVTSNPKGRKSQRRAFDMDVTVKI
jgi:predicted phosphodiesterase